MARRYLWIGLINNLCAQSRSYLCLFTLRVERLCISLRTVVRCLCRIRVELLRNIRINSLRVKARAWPSIQEPPAQQKPDHRRTGVRDVAGSNSHAIKEIGWADILVYKYREKQILILSHSATSSFPVNWPEVFFLPFLSGPMWGSYEGFNRTP